MSKITLLRALIDRHYAPMDYPVLYDQIARWRADQPFRGLRLLDATPLFRNTLVKHLALLEAGAELTIGISDAIPPDPQMAAFVSQCGIPLVRPDEAVVDPIGFDLVLDCAASFSTTSMRIGAVELTRSGCSGYEGFGQPVFVADSGRIKQIETFLGTGESLFRALAQLGHTDLSGRSLLLFGSGKVGKGIICYAAANGLSIVVVTDPTTLTVHELGRIASVVHFDDASSIRQAVDRADLIVAATGVKHGIARHVSAEQLYRSRALLCNMGVEDEFPADLPADEVLNNKRALNFILDEPTHLRYIDATMALHNAGALHLFLNPNLPTGLIVPPTAMEQEMLRLTRLGGRIAEELTWLSDATQED